MNEFKKLSEDILKDKKYLQMKKFIAHSDITCYTHCYNVALKSYNFVKKHNIKCSLKELIRGALLHDYYLYDWHENKIKWHGFKHHKIAYLNAKRDFDITKKEVNIILSHMFPLTIWRLPLCKEAWIVTLFDKIEAWKETLKKYRKNKK